ncbi:MAG: hypothetical protein KDA84_20720 [Planctomycetaceae bacterium]|nr:hypothetical protein [Planctomycetaceae bacterium]
MASSSNNQQPNPLREIILGGIWLTAAVALVLPVSLWWGNDFAGDTGLVAAGVAAGLGWLASMVALVFRTQFPKPQDAVAGTMGAMLIRMVMILGGGMLLASRFRELVPAALWGQLMVYFFLTLTVETLLAVRWVKKMDNAALSEDSSGQSSLSENSAKAI